MLKNIFGFGDKLYREDFMRIISNSAYDLQCLRSFQNERFVASYLENIDKTKHESFLSYLNRSNRKMTKFTEFGDNYTSYRRKDLLGTTQKTQPASEWLMISQGVTKSPCERLPKQSQDSATAWKLSQPSQDYFSTTVKKHPLERYTDDPDREVGSDEPPYRYEVRNDKFDRFESTHKNGSFKISDMATELSQQEDAYRDNFDRKLIEYRPNRVKSNTNQSIYDSVRFAYLREKKDGYWERKPTLSRASSYDYRPESGCLFAKTEKIVNQGLDFTIKRASENYLNHDLEYRPNSSALLFSSTLRKADKLFKNKEIPMPIPTNGQCFNNCLISRSSEKNSDYEASTPKHESSFVGKPENKLEKTTNYLPSPEITTFSPVVSTFCSIFRYNLARKKSLDANILSSQEDKNKEKRCETSKTIRSTFKPIGERPSRPFCSDAEKSIPSKQAPAFWRLSAQQKSTIEFLRKDKELLELKNRLKGLKTTVSGNETSLANNPSAFNSLQRTDWHEFKREIPSYILDDEKYLMFVFMNN